jgi:hypothetical protein
MNRKIVLEEIDTLCIHVLSVILHYAIALDEDADSVKLGLTRLEDRESAYLQCVDPVEVIHREWDS